MLARGADLNGILRNIGGYAGLACGIHCMAMPLLVTLLPVLGLGFMAHEWFEIGLLVSATILASISLCWGYHQHGKFHAVWFLLGGVAWFATGHLFHHSVWFSLAGGLFFLVASLVNHRLCKTCGRCCEKR